MKMWTSFLILLILIILLYIFYRQYQINDIENFDVSALTYLNLDPNQYPSIPKDHPYYGNSPVSDEQVLCVKRGGKYCFNGMNKPYREIDMLIPCEQMSNNVNNLFSVPVNDLSQKYKEKTIELSKEYDNKVDTETRKNLDLLVKRYSEVQEEILYAKKFLEENKINASKYKKNNKKLSEKLGQININTNKGQQKTLIYKQTYDELKNKNAQLHKYSRWLVYIIVILTLIYLFRKRYNDFQSNNIASI